MKFVQARLLAPVIVLTAWIAVGACGTQVGNPEEEDISKPPSEKTTQGPSPDGTPQTARGEVVVDNKQPVGTSSATLPAASSSGLRTCSSTFAVQEPTGAAGSSTSAGTIAIEFSNAGANVATIQTSGPSSMTSTAAAIFNISAGVYDIVISRDSVPFCALQMNIVAADAVKHCVLTVDLANP